MHYRRNTISLGFPPFTPTIKALLFLYGGIYLLQALLGMVAPELAGSLLYYCALTPALVARGWIWQLFTYSFLHAGLLHVLFNMLALWMFGSSLEQAWRRRKFLEFYFFCILGAALVTVGLAFAGIPRMSPLTPTVGASGGIYGLLLAFGMIYGEQEVLFFPLPFTMKAKYMVALLIFIALASSFQPAGNSIAYVAHLGGLFFGYFYLKWGPRHGFADSLSERYFGMRNAYYRWKRRRAARKFQVYMRKRGDDRAHYFDEHGNYRGPDLDEPGKKPDDDSKENWIN